MFEGKCLKCGWVGKSTDCLSQWWELDNETSKLLLICPICREGAVVENKVKNKRR